MRHLRYTTDEAQPVDAQNESEEQCERGQVEQHTVRGLVGRGMMTCGAPAGRPSNALLTD